MTDIEAMQWSLNLVYGFILYMSILSLHHCYLEFRRIRRWNKVAKMMAEMPSSERQKRLDLNLPMPWEKI